MNIFRWTVAFLVGGIGVFAVLELSSMLFLPKPWVDKAPLVKAAYHPTLGYSLIPNQQTYTYSEPVQTNRHGLRDRELDPSGLRSSMVVLCLGGSETFGKGIAAENTFARILEEKLNGSGSSGETRRVINAGVPDYNLAQSLRFLEEEGEQYFPDVVVLSFYWDDLLPLEGTRGGKQEHRPTQAPVGREWIVRTWARQLNLLEVAAPIYTRSRVLCFARNQLKNWIGNWRGNTSITWRSAILRGEHFPPLEQAWLEAIDLLERFVALAEQRSFLPLLMVLPIEHQVEGHYPGARYQAVVIPAAQALSLETIDLLPHFRREYARSHSLFIPYDGRPNIRAHALTAEVLVEAVRGLGTPSPPDLDSKKP